MTEVRSRVIEWEDPLAGREGLAGLSGLEQLRAMAAGQVPRPPISALMDIRASRFEPGVAVFEGTPAEFHYNPIGVVHGGFAATILDSALGCAVHTTLAPGERYTTLEIKINYVRPITLDTGPVTAEARVLHRGRTSATAEGRLVSVRDGKLLAHGTTTCQVMPAAPAVERRP